MMTMKQTPDKMMYKGVNVEELYVAYERLKRQNELTKNYIRDHPEEHREQSKKYYHNNKEEINARRRERNRLKKEAELK